jgi:hypothetical protein
MVECGLVVLFAICTVSAQVVTINTQTGVVTNGTAGAASSVDRRYAQIKPTQVQLAPASLDAKTRQELIRALQSEQGFAMRPFPRGHKGLTLVANGKLEPAGEQYQTMAINEGLAAKPGDRVVLSDVKIDRSKIVFELNGGPDRKHRFLRHVQIGMGPALNPVVQEDGQEPAGARLTLSFQKGVPELTGSQVKALLAPLISFDVKTPIEAFTDTLPPMLKNAILSHHVLVGMSTDMVLFAKGKPERKTREMEGQMPFEEWIYGSPPQDVEFVRINGNRVIRVEVAKVGEPVAIFTKDEVEGMMRTDGTPLTPGGPPNTHTIEMGDAERNPDTQAPAPPPSLRNPGETVPNDARVGVMKPVQFPKQKPETQPDASPDGQSGTAQPPSQTPPASSPSPGSAQTQPADASQAAPVKPAPDSSQPQ